jgi:hypothetical protein
MIAFCLDLNDDGSPHEYVLHDLDGPLKNLSSFADIPEDYGCNVCFDIWRGGSRLACFDTSIFAARTIGRIICEWTIQNRPASSASDYFGLCPICHREGRCRNIGRDHWFACDLHRLKWLVGSNLFSNWREEDKEQWLENERVLSAYKKAEPYFLPTKETAQLCTASTISDEEVIPF